MIHLNPTNLIAVPVPEDAGRIYISRLNYLCALDTKYTILGTVTKDTIDFNVEPYVEKEELEVTYYKYAPRTVVKYADGSESLAISTTDKNDAFRSFLSANEAYFENPYGEEPQITTDTALTEIEKYGQWQNAQSKVNNKYVILQKITRE